MRSGIGCQPIYSLKAYSTPFGDAFVELYIGIYNTDLQIRDCIKSPAKKKQPIKAKTTQNLTYMAGIFNICQPKDLNI